LRGAPEEKSFEISYSTKTIPAAHDLNCASNVCHRGELKLRQQGAGVFVGGNFDISRTAAQSYQENKSIISMI
jgi:hypothetical protein